MKWVNHILIAGAATAIINPAAVPFAVLGATAPDWIETVSNRFLGTHFKHRQETHYPVLWLGDIGFAFCALCVVVHNSLSTDGGFMPFLFNWGEYYDQGLISGKEWKENRFTFF